MRGNGGCRRAARLPPEVRAAVDAPPQPGRGAELRRAGPNEARKKCCAPTNRAPAEDCGATGSATSWKWTASSARRARSVSSVAARACRICAAKNSRRRSPPTPSRRPARPAHAPHISPSSPRSTTPPAAGATPFSRKENSPMKLPARLDAELRANPHRARTPSRRHQATGACSAQRLARALCPKFLRALPGPLPSGLRLRLSAENLRASCRT